MKLRADAELIDPPAQRRDITPVRVTLTNEGAEPIVVNARFAPGYGESLSREVYAELTTPDGAPAAHNTVRYDRDWPTKEDFAELAPGESVSGEFDLFEWYRPLEPGAYRVVIFYEDEHHSARTAPLELEVA